MFNKALGASKASGFSAASGIVLRGLERPAERWCLAASVLLCMVYLGALGCLQRASTRIDDAFLARRDTVRLSHLLQHRVTLGVPMTVSDERITLLNGWSAPETWGVWTDGARAELGLALPASLPASPVLQITAAIMPPPGAQQSIRLEANGHRLGQWRFGNVHAVICAALPPEVTAGSGLLRLGITIAAPQPPSGGLDTRDLGLGLETLTILPAAAACGGPGR